MSSNNTDNQSSNADAQSQSGAPSRQNTTDSTGSSACSSQGESVWDEFPDFSDTPKNISRATTWDSNYDGGDGAANVAQQPQQGGGGAQGQGGNAGGN